MATETEQGFRVWSVDTEASKQDTSFYTLPDSEAELLRNRISSDRYDVNTAMSTPYGSKTIVYADSTASGQSLKHIESYIQSHVLPTYSNTHSSSNAAGLQTMQFVQEARQIIKNTINASDSDAVIFTGSGATAAISQFARILSLSLVSEQHAADTYTCSFPGCSLGFADKAQLQLHARHHNDGDHASFQAKEASAAPRFSSMTVFVGPVEHHSNVLVWREAGAQVIEVPSGPHHMVDMQSLERLVQQHRAPRRLLVGAFSAASNVTGLREHVHEVTALMHRHGGLACWDYATAAPHDIVNMNPPSSDAHSGLELAPDAVFISPHKFAGGPGTPGLLCVKKKWLANSVPSVPGGGTVFYVTSQHHRYIQNPEEREEGGTPNIVGAIRCGLVFQLHASIGAGVIRRHEDAIVERVLAGLEGSENLDILGGTTSVRHPIFSIMIRHPKTSKFLHWAFVTSLLSDLFGIQGRGGCLCAGPYGHKLLGIDDATAALLEDELVQKNEVLRPGFVRISMTYLWDMDKVDFVVAALQFVAQHGHLFLGEYMFYPESGEFRHRSLRNKSPFRSWLHDVSYATGDISIARPALFDPKQSAPTFKDTLASAHEQLASIKASKSDAAILAPEVLLGLPEERHHLRWFATVADNHAPAPPTPSIGTQVPGTVRLVAAAADNETAAACPLILMKKEDTQTDEQDKQAAQERELEAAEEELDMLEFAADSDDDSDDNTQSTAASRWTSAQLRPPVPKSLLKPIGEAIREFDMIQEGDRVLVGVSGGKDSLTLLHALLALQRKAPIKFDVGAVTMHPNFPGFDPTPLVAYFAAMGVPYFFEEHDLMALAKTTNPSSICAWCSRMKRGILYSCARRENYNVLALGQHMDDLCESFVMSTFHNGRLRTMKAHYCNSDRDIRIIRPLVYTREHQTRAFADAVHLPVIQDNCPACFESPKERYRVKTLLAQQENIYPNLLNIILRALKPLLRDHTFPLCASAAVQQSVDARYGQFVLPGKTLEQAGEDDED